MGKLWLVSTLFLKKSVTFPLLMQWCLVDGAAWRTGSSPGAGFKYPDFLLSDEVVTGVKGGKKSKL